MTIKALLMGALTLAFGVTLAQSLPQITPQGVIVNPVQTTLNVSVTLDKRGSDPIYIAGEKQRISVTVNQDAFVYVFNLQPNGAISVLLPNGYSSGTPYLRAGMS